jgi:hypothetical protein
MQLNKSLENDMSINDATPAEWDRLRKEHPAIEVTVDGKEVDMVNHPSHYTYGKIECIEGIQESMSAEAFKGYCKGACLKYLWRYERKGKPLEDLKKAQWYLNKLIEVVENE